MSTYLPTQYYTMSCSIWQRNCMYQCSLPSTNLSVLYLPAAPRALHQYLHIPTPVGHVPTRLPPLRMTPRYRVLAGGHLLISYLLVPAITDRMP